MAIILSQKFKQKQKLALTPSLKKSIDLLQLSRFELINKIQQEIEDNPFLEKIEDFENDSLLDKDFSFEIESKVDLKGSLLNQINDLNFLYIYKEISFFFFIFSSFFDAETLFFYFEIFFSRSRRSHIYITFLKNVW